MPSAAHLTRYFGRKRAIWITPADLKGYIVRRQQAGAAKATINRELAALRRGFALGHESGFFLSVPPVPTLRERVGDLLGRIEAGFTDNSSRPVVYRLREGARRLFENWYRRREAPLLSLGREIPTPVGSIDNLFLSRNGYLVVVETTLWRNPEARR